jgi:hypothetical protein
MSWRSNSADGGGVGMPVEPYLLNAVEPSADGLRREGQRLLRALTRLQGRAMAVSFDLRAMNVPMQKEFEFLGAHFLSNENLDNGLAGRLEAIRDLIDDINSLVDLFAARLSGTPSVSPSGSGPGILRVMEDQLSMPMPTPGSGACQPMGPTTSPNAAIAALVQFASRGAFRAPLEAPRGAKRPRKGEEQCVVPEEEDRAPTEAKKPRKGEAQWVVPKAAAKRHFTHYMLNNMVYQVATHNPAAEKRQTYEVNDFLSHTTEPIQPPRIQGIFGTANFPGGCKRSGGKQG